MNITKNKAYEFWKHHMGDKKHFIHCSQMINACLNVTQYSDLNKEIFIIAGWLHDMGKLINKEHHNVMSLEYLDKFVMQYKEYEYMTSELFDCIYNHRTTGTPETIYGIIFRWADKMGGNIK